MPMATASRDVHINTLEGLWTRVRNCLGLFWSVSRWFLIGYLAVFEWAHNLKDMTADFIAMMIVAFTSSDT